MYTGVTNNLERRMYEHKHHSLAGFTSKYDVTRLVWFIQGADIASAIELEKKIKNRGRQWKINLIEKTNPNWNDLSAHWMDSATTPNGSAQNDEDVICSMTGMMGRCMKGRRALPPAPFQRSRTSLAMSFCAERSDVAGSITRRKSCNFVQDDGDK